MRYSGDDRGAMRMVTLTRLVVVLAIIGVLGYDGFSCMSARVTTENDAQNAAYAASQAWHDNLSKGGQAAIDAAYQAAIAELANKPADKVLSKDFTADSDGTIHLIVVRTAHTILFGHISALHSLIVAKEHGDANSVN